MSTLIKEDPEHNNGSSSDQIFAIDSPQNLTLVNSIIKEESVDDHKKILKKSVSKISSELSSFEKTSRHVR
jgi:hypothetical protein